MQNGLVEKFRALTATRFVPFFAFNFDRQFLANIFVLLTPINQGYPPTHGQHSTLLWLRTHPCGGAPHPGYVVFHTQTALLGWGTTSVVLSMPDDMPPLGWGITLVDGGQSRQRDKQYAPIFQESGLTIHTHVNSTARLKLFGVLRDCCHGRIGIGS